MTVHDACVCETHATMILILNEYNCIHKFPQFTILHKTYILLHTEVNMFYELNFEKFLVISVNCIVPNTDSGKVVHYSVS